MLRLKMLNNHLSNIDLNLHKLNRKILLLTIKRKQQQINSKHLKHKEVCFKMLFHRIRNSHQSSQTPTQILPIIKHQI